MGTESHSGEFAAVNGQAAVRKWNIARVLPLNEAKHSGTRGGTQRKKGVGSWTGGWTAEGGQPGVKPGEKFTFLGYSAPDNDTEGGTGTTYTGVAVVSSVTLTLDQTTNNIISHEVTFDGHLILTETAGGAAIIDAVASIAECAVDTKIEYGATPDEIEDWTTATLTFTANVPSFVNSSTAGETGRRETSDIDWTLSIGVEVTDSPLAEGLQLEDLKVYINSIEFWHLNYARVGTYSGFVADRETKAIIAQTLNIAMDSHKESDGSLGSIIMPDTTQLWPPTP